MSGRELLVDEIDGRLYAAVVRKGRVDNLYVDAKDRTGCWASLYLGKVVKVDQRLDAAFVDLGSGLTGFLPAKHVYLKGVASRSGITELVKPGDRLLVQVKAEAKKESRYETSKLPRLTTKIYCFGQYFVYGPMVEAVKNSHEKSAEIVSRLPGKGGWIVHPAAQRASEDEMQFEARNLVALWDRIQLARSSDGDTPRLIRSGPTAMARALYDYGVLAFDNVHVANKKLLEDAMSWSKTHDAGFADSKRLRLFKPENTTQKLFDMVDVFSALHDLEASMIALPSGGSIIIETTQAFTVVDVNQGSAQNIQSANQEAAFEIVRQCRMRNLNGAILADFINMSQKTDRAALIDYLEKCFQGDRAGPQVHGFTRLGIIEITRKRRSATLAEKLRS